MAKKEREYELRTSAWRMIGWTVSEPGVMSYDGRRLSYDNGEKVLFDAELSEVTELKFPWYYFGGGLKMTVKGEPYRFSFVVPNGAEVGSARLATAIDPLLGAGAVAEVVAGKVADVKEGREATRAWRKLLEPLVR